MSLYKDVIGKIGTPAMLEQTAEECSELAQACLKLARHMRNENPTFREEYELKLNFYEEIADVELCLKYMESIIDRNVVEEYKENKRSRTNKRLFKDEKGFEIVTCQGCKHLIENNDGSVECKKNITSLEAFNKLNIRPCKEF